MTKPCVVVSEKPCRKCGGVFALDQFPKHSKMADGHLHRCRACDKACQRAYGEGHRERLKAKSKAWYHARSEEINAAQRARYVADPEYRAQIAADGRAFRARNPERGRMQARAWYEAHKAEANAASTKRNRENPERRAEYQRRMRARQKGATVIDLSFEQWQKIMLVHAGCCHYCGAEDDIGMDHMRPIQRGGDHTASNVVPCCRSCNTSKGEQTPAEWLAKQEAA